MRGTTAGTLGLVAAALGILPAAAHAGTTWEGRCSIDGVTTFDRPIGFLPRPATYRDRGTGTCTGRLDGEPVRDAPVQLAARGEGVLGCLGGTSVMPGRITFTQGTVTEEDDVTTHYVGEAAGVFPTYVSLSRGRSSGRGIAFVTMLAGADPAQGEACRRGALRSARWEATTQTLGVNES